MTKVEEVARAISRLVPIDGSQWCEGHGHDFPREYSEDEKVKIRGIALAALKAMRMPSEGMLAAAYRVNTANYVPLTIWQAQIDAAIAESEA